MPAFDEMDNKKHGKKSCCCFRCGATHSHINSANANNTGCNWEWWARTAFIFGLIAFFIWSVAAWGDIKTQFRACLTWVDQLGMFYGSLVLCCANIIGAILFLPCLPFTLASGFLYGTFFGTILVSIASTLAAVFSFLIARYLARKLIETRLGSKGSRFRLLDNAINKDGFRVVFLIRSSPIHPYGLCNYLFGLTSITLRDYTVASFIAMLPATVCEVYFGTAMKNVADILSGNLQDGLLSRVFFWGGLAVTLLVTIMTSCWLKEKLKTELDKYEGVGDTDPDPLPSPRDIAPVVSSNLNGLLNVDSTNHSLGRGGDGNDALVDDHSVSAVMFVSGDRSADLRDQLNRERTPFLLDNKKLSTSPHGVSTPNGHGSAAYISFSMPSSSSLSQIGNSIAIPSHSHAGLTHTLSSTAQLRVSPTPS